MWLTALITPWVMYALGWGPKPGEIGVQEARERLENLKQHKKEKITALTETGLAMASLERRILVEQVKEGYAGAEEQLAEYDARAKSGGLSPLYQKGIEQVNLLKDVKAEAAVIKSLGYATQASGALPSLSVEGGYAALGNIIMSGESAQKGYSDYVPGKNFKNPVRGAQTIPKRLGLQGMTIGSILAKQKAGELGAVGKYQLIGTTLRMAVDAGVVSAMDKFGPNAQEKIYKWIINKKRPEIGQYLKTGENSIAAQIAMAKEWASIGMPIDYDVTDEHGNVIRSIKQGQSYYAGVGSNKALIGPSQIAIALANLHNAVMTLAAQQTAKLARYSASGNSQPIIITNSNTGGDQTAIVENISLDPQQFRDREANAFYRYG